MSKMKVRSGVYSDTPKERGPRFAEVPDGTGKTRVEPNYRIISVPNGFWVPQVKLTEAGSRFVDCWYSVGREMTEEDAMIIAVTWASAKRSINLHVLDASPDFRSWLGEKRDTPLKRIEYLRRL